MSKSKLRLLKPRRTTKNRVLLEADELDLLTRMARKSGVEEAFMFHWIGKTALRLMLDAKIEIPSLELSPKG